MMLQRADLAAKLGYAEEARVWYLRVLDLWSEADPELQAALPALHLRRGHAPARDREREQDRPPAPATAHRSTGSSSAALKRPFLLVTVS